MGAAWAIKDPAIGTTALAGPQSRVSRRGQGEFAKEKGLPAPERQGPRHHGYVKGVHKVAHGLGQRGANHH
eukprot:14219766-Alexandrium_andersonii.AAC.1